MQFISFVHFFIADHIISYHSISLHCSSFMHAFVGSLIHSFIHSFMHSCCSFVPPPSHPIPISYLFVAFHPCSHPSLHSLLPSFISFHLMSRHSIKSSRPPSKSTYPVDNRTYHIIPLEQKQKMYVCTPACIDRCMRTYA